MKKMMALFLMGMFVLCSAGSLMAANQSSKADAQALVLKASEYVQKHGLEKAIAEFNNPKGEFVKGDLYIFAYDFTGTNKALVTNPSMIGKNLIEMKDADGKFMIKDLIAIANKGGGWYDYKWAHPVTKESKAKASYVVKVADNLWLGCGVYL